MNFDPSFLTGFAAVVTALGAFGGLIIGIKVYRRAQTIERQTDGAATRQGALLAQAMEMVAEQKVANYDLVVEAKTSLQMATNAMAAEKAASAEERAAHQAAILAATDLAKRLQATIDALSVPHPTNGGGPDGSHAHETDVK